jgi:tRNA(Ile)-lysidine synthase
MGDVQKVLELSVKKGSSLTLQLRKKVRVNKSYNKMIFTTLNKKTSSFQYEVSVPGRVIINETGDIYEMTVVNKEEYCPQSQVTCLDYDKLPENIYLRSRRPGDVFRPKGMAGSKKLKKYFIDLKVPYGQRDDIVLLAAEGQEIYAVLGFGVSRNAAVSNNTRMVLLIKNITAGENRGRD